MTTKTDGWETALQSLIFLNTVPSWATGTGVILSHFQLSIHSQDPGEAGSQTTSEVSYGGYSRTAINRNSGNWTVSGANVSNAGNILLPECNSGSATGRFIGIGTASSGAGNLLYRGLLGGTPRGFYAVASTDYLTVLSHTFSLDQEVYVYSNPAYVFPGGITSGQVYYVVDINGDDIKLSLTVGGAVQNITTNGFGTIIASFPINITVGVIPVIKTGNLIIIED